MVPTERETEREKEKKNDARQILFLSDGGGGWG